MSFEHELSQGRFFIPTCSVCNNVVWPPVEYCSKCFGQVSLKKGSLEGRIIEFSIKNNTYFCLVELEANIRIMAKRAHIPKIGQKVKISKCGIENGNYFFTIN